MVKNGADSLRGMKRTASVMSLESEIQDDAASRRIAELEAQVENMRKASEIPMYQHWKQSYPYMPYTSSSAYGTDATDRASYEPINLSYRRANGETSGHPAGPSTMYQEFADMMKTQESKSEHALKAPEAYTEPFCTFLTTNPTVWHAVDYFDAKLKEAGFKKVCPAAPIAELPLADFARMVVHGTRDMETRGRREILYH
jgi:hypothetical protein